MVRNISEEEFKAYIAKLVNDLGPQYAMPIDQVPIIVIDLLSKTRTDSPFFDKIFALFCTEEARRDIRYRTVVVRPQEVAAYAADLCRGILYAARNFEPEQPKPLDTLKKFKIARYIETESGKLSNEFATCLAGDELIINPNAIVEHAMQAKSRNPARYIQDHKVPGKAFNNKEDAILSGMEEMVHYYQTQRSEDHPGPRIPTYVFGESSKRQYENDPMEMEAGEFLKKAADELGLGGPLEKKPASVREVR